MNSFGKKLFVFGTFVTLFSAKGYACVTEQHVSNVARSIGTLNGLTDLVIYPPQPVAGKVNTFQITFHGVRGGYATYGATYEIQLEENGYCDVQRIELIDSLD